MQGSGFGCGWRSALTLLITVGGVLAFAASALATVTTTNVTTPADGTLVFDNHNTDPSKTFAVAGTSDGVTGDRLDIRCLQLATNDPGTFYLGTPYTVSVRAGGSFSANVPVADMPPNTCQLVAVPHGTGPDRGPDFTGPSVSFSTFSNLTISGGPSAGKPYNFLDAITGISGQDYTNSLSACGDSTTLMSWGSLTNNVYPFNCGGQFYGSPGDYGRPTDLGRSGIQVDGTNAYGSASAHNLFAGADQRSGFPTIRDSVTFDAATGNEVLTDSESIARCAPRDVYGPTAADCRSFVPTGVSDTRVTRSSDSAQVMTITDTFASRDGHRHTLDLLDEVDAPSSGGWALPGQSAFIQHGRGTVGAPSSAPGTVYDIVDRTQRPSFTDPVGAMTFGTPYSSVRFDNTLIAGEESALFGYRLTVPAGGSTSITWSYATTSSLAEARAQAAAAEQQIELAGRAPTVELTGLASRMSLKAFLRGVRFSVQPDKRASLQVMLVASTSRATIAGAGNLILASRRFASSAAARKVVIVPQRRLVGDPKQARVQVVTVATDQFGRESTTARVITVTRAPR